MTRYEPLGQDGPCTTRAIPDHEVLIIGAGFSGIGAAIRLDRSGFDDWRILEQASGAGGAWHANTYPGVAVDTPSFSYSFSFEQNPDWSSVFAPGAELKAYAEHCIRKYRLASRIRYHCEVTGATFDETSDLWRLQLGDGSRISARHVILATGVLTKPKPPEIPGLQTFRGKTMHTARWDHDHNLSGQRVGIIGTGASALQVIPNIAPDVERLVVFQRTPIWVLPKPDFRLGRAMRTLFRYSPPAQWAARLASHLGWEVTAVLTTQYNGYLPGLARRMERSCRKHLREQVPDPVLRDKLTPQYGFGCKRPSLSNNYLRTFMRDNVALETTPIECVTESGIRTSAGTEHSIDTLILATGFKVFEVGNMPPFPIRGCNDQDLEQWWNLNRYQAYQGVSVPDFPNLYTILGPYGYNGTVYFQLIESQTRHIIRCLQQAKKRGATRVDIRREANDRYFRDMLERRAQQVFFNGTCGNANSYYFDRHGDVPFRAATSLETQWRASRFRLSDYRFSGQASAQDQLGNRQRRPRTAASTVPP